ncbi:MAG: gamma-glutamyl-gamma-aminobutyrate hydrolase family protein [Acidobacteriota bacterium]|nr:gamma-glutamyl-gamma-aminobutyrate hydrolase family protein [Acidobacteriota bacterium]
MFDSTPAILKSETLPFPFNNRAFCRYEPIEKKIEHARVLIVNDLLRYEDDLSDLARKEWNGTTKTKLRFERKISGMACDNIAKNVLRLVQNPKTLTVHLSEVGEAAASFNPDAIVMSGTLSDFDYYNPEQLKKFERFIKKTKIPVLGICGAHQLIGMSFGGRLTTLDNLDASEKRTDRVVEYQYRFIKITDQTDPIFAGATDVQSGIWQDYTLEDDILRVWQNHGLQVEGIPEGFHQLATAYLCKNQMMVKRSGGQLIYTVQFHLEKSFEDWSKNPTRWEHPNESRDGRILFENFLKLALKHK